ncbi:MAG: thioredoxin fold domain-containing protein [Deltaproteobacteria bacterium]|nr:thioredoxin fold domain-containing protein [Deltaproteobacteria bacterium]
MRKQKHADRGADIASPGPARSGPVIEIRGRSQFEAEVIDSELPVVVDFWGSRCAPCRVMAPVFQACAEAFADQARFVKVNTETNAQIARAFNIRSIPTLAIFYRGEVFDVHVGATPRNQLEAMVRRAVDKHRGVGLFDKLKRFWSRPSNPPA